MGIFDRSIPKPEEFASDAGMSESSASYGGTPNVLGDYSVADEWKDSLPMGSAKDAELNMDMFGHMPPGAHRG